MSFIKNIITLSLFHGCIINTSSIFENCLLVFCLLLTRAVTNIRTLESSRTHLEIRTQIFACLCFARFANIPIFYSYSNYKIISFEWICFCAKIVTLKKKLAYLFTCDCRIRNMLCPKLLLVKLEVQFRIIINWRNNKFLRKWRSQTHL